MKTLDDKLYERIEVLSAEGDELAEEGNFDAALEHYWKAWDLIPEPKHEWDATLWLLVAIGDANFNSGDFEAGRDNLSNAMQCPDALGNPYVHMRLGQCQFELQNFDRAKDELCRAFMGAGEELFEDEDPKYLEYLKKRLDKE